ncbi:hypothetical protein B0T11DRAFT_277523 [Plectosphaerella cucumerina]|uniref:TauD/TfdA-like domain-containing protein n=1 Tax=Plectosphaerella cucumerina TaxID=40658 RepID=A0A8K0X878_9PEZI|nr:hypothetical protein B0T11DRAFT_277523 [Plectosphaerella cucumerina]
MRVARPMLAFRASASRCIAPASRAPSRCRPFATTRAYSQVVDAPVNPQTTEQLQEPALPRTAHKRVTIRTEKYGSKVVPVAWLRDHCPQSRSPTSGNKSFATAEIPEDINIKSMQPTSDGGLRIEWENDIPRFASQNHVTVFTHEQLETAMTTNSQSLSKKKRVGVWVMPPLLWDRLTIEPRVLRVSYEDWMKGGDEFLRAVAEIQLTGLVFITGAPRSQDAVAEMGLRFGALQETFYGRTWDVISKPAAENVAYTSEYLGLHSDMLYLDSPPRLQLLHCLENEAEGGESLFADAGRAARELRLFYPESARILERWPIGYHYEANGFSYHQERPVIQAPRNGAGRVTRGIIRPWWSPPFQVPFNQPLGHRADVWEAWHSAARKFQGLIEDPEAVYRHRLQPGECAVFDNGRVLHGRTAFDPATGPRHLRGTYVHEDDWRSTLQRVPRHIYSDVSGGAFGPRTSTELFTSLRYIKYRHLKRDEVAPPPTLFDRDTRTAQERKAGMFHIEEDFALEDVAEGEEGAAKASNARGRYNNKGANNRRWHKQGNGRVQ